MSHLNPGLILAYNSLTDKHLTGYFSNTRIRRHLQRAGLITRSGRIVPDREYRHKLIQRAHQRHVRECLAQAIFHKVLEMERLHQIEIKKKLEEFSRRERVHKIKLERSRRYEEDIIRILSPRPPTGARGIRKQHSGPEGEHSESSESLGSSRPNTAPGKMQRPVRLKPIHSNSAAVSLRRSSPYRHLESSNDSNQPFNCTMDKESRRRFTTVEASSSISPYCLPVINNFVTPVPPAIKRKDTGLKVTPSSTLRGRRLRPTTASSGADVNEEPFMPFRSSVHQSRVGVNMVYFGKTVHLSHDLADMRDEVKVFQQHCGGENLCVFKGKLLEGESFQFMSRRHRGFPFSLTFFLNGLQVERLSSCCEFKHRKGSRLGGRHGHFGFSSVKGASPCYKCIIAMGLDKKPTPPPKRVREETFSSSKDAPEMETEKTAEDAAHPDFKRNQQQDMKSQVKDETAEEDKVRDDYEEDFEADDEGPAEEVREKTSPSPTSETETQVKERDGSEPEDNEKDEDSDSRSGSSSSGSSREASDAEATKDSREDEKAEQPEELDQEETVAPPEEKKQPNPEEGAATETEPAVAKDSDLQDSAGDSAEMDIPDSSIPCGSEIKQCDTISVEKEAEKTVDEGKQEESQEQERAKSVQEKLAEAVLTASRRSSEHDLRDPSIEEEEATGKGQEQSNNDLLPEKLVVFTEVQQTLSEETKSVGVGEAEMVQDHEATSEPKEEEGKETEKEAQESSDSTKDEKVEMAEDDGILAEEETAEKDHSEDTGAAMTEENKTSEPQEDAASQSTDADVAGKDKEHEGEKDTEVEEVQPDEIGQGAKCRGEDESSASEPNKKADEAAALDNAEAEEMVTASETMEVKTERKALGCEEAPVSDAEERQPADTKDTMNVSETEVHSSSSVEKTADISEDNAKDRKDYIKEGEAEISKDGNKQERLGEEQTEKLVEKDEEIEKEKCEEKQTNSDELPEDENRVQKGKNETDKTEKSERLTEERIENDEIIIEDTKTDSSTNEEVAKKTLHGEDKETNEERIDECKMTEKDEESECVERKNDEEESEAKGAMPDETNESEEIKEAKTDSDGEKEDEAEKDDDGNKFKQSQSKKIEDERESEEKKNVTCETEEGEISVITEEPERNVHYVRIPDKNIAESEDVGDGEAAEEIPNKVLESEEKETGGAHIGSEKADIDAENGEISTRGERKSQEDDTEPSSEDKNYVKAAEIDEDNQEMEEKPAEEETTEVKEITVECGDERVDQGPDTDTAGSEAKHHDEDIEKQAEVAPKDSEQETSGTEIKEESKPDVLNAGRENQEEINDENGNKFDFDNESRDKDSTRNDNDANEAIAAASDTQPRPSTSTDLCIDGTTSATQLLNEFTAISEKHPRSDENAVVIGLPAADTEEASVLLKPQAQNTEDSITTDKDTPEALTADVGTDLVTNWVTMHQTSKFFETFVEPLEELTEEASHAQVPAPSEEVAKSTELLRLKVTKVSENEKEGQMQGMHEDETKVENNVGVVGSGLESKQAEDGECLENDPAKDTLQEDEEETEVQDLTLKTEDSDKESDQQRKGSGGSPQENIVQDGPALKNEMSKSEVENVAGPLVASSNPDGVREKQTGEEITDNHPDWNDKQTTTEAIKDLRPSSKTEEHHEQSAGPDGPRDAEEAQGKREVTEIADFTASNLEDGSQEGSHDGGGQSKLSDQGINGERRDVEPIQDLKHTLSKDRLSTFSVDETLFGRSSYPLLTAAKTESGH